MLTIAHELVRRLSEHPGAAEDPSRFEAVPEEDRFEFIVEAGENVVLPKSDIICWEEYAEGQTAAILSREAMLAKRAQAMRHDEGENP
ncbi:hypothetical protein [Verrucomicrobium spinosum]|uniref:hypothetical protein n=1 Tax=Verrucomicrobium spinosum TaxID=2736 RepID=UPI0009468242|nr:hypothetical protein [Verrucomicrobium spinosum]